MRTTNRASRVCTALLLLTCATAGSATEVAVCTDFGPMTIELLDKEAPLHTANFLRYVDEGFYSGTVFHRVVAGFVVQGGGYDRKLQRRETLEPIENESRNGLSNVRGTLAAARTSDPNSATAQFFINLTDNTRLDATDDDLGYTVFGRVESGMDVIDRIAGLPTSSAASFEGDVPEPLVAVSSMAVLDSKALAKIPEASRPKTLIKRIFDAMGANDPEQTLEWVRLYRSTCAPLLPDVLLAEAKAAAALGKSRRAQYALEDYFTIADSSHPTFASAQELFATLSPDAQPGVEPLIGQCKAPEVPPIPNGSVDSLDVMVDAQSAIRSFMSESEVYLDCISEIIDERKLDDEQHAAAVRQHNQMVGLMEDVAEDFNKQVRIFKAREQ